MYWSKSSDAQGMCDGPKDMDAIKMKFDSLEEQAADPASIYNYVKDVIRLRNQNPVIARGEVRFHELVSSDTVCVISKEYEGEKILLVFNISAQSTKVDLSSVYLGNENAAEASDTAEILPASMEVIGELLTGEEDIEREGAVFTMSAYSVLVLGK